MPFLVRYVAPAEVEAAIDDAVLPVVLTALGGYTIEEGTVLDHLHGDWPDRGAWRGGQVRMAVDGAGDGDHPVSVVVEIGVDRELSAAELERLRVALDGQMSDGLGAGGFEPLAEALAVTVEPLSLMSSEESRIGQSAGALDRPPPRAQVARQNRARLAAARAALAGPGAPASAARRFKPVQRALFDLGDRPDEAKLAALAKALATVQNDLSGVPPRWLPYMLIAEPRLVRMLLDAGLDPHLRDTDGHALLYLVTQSPACIRLVLDRGVDVNAINDDRFRDTALKWAARSGNVESVALLLERGADPHVRGGLKNTTALEDARAAKEKAVIALLEPLG